MRFGVCTDINMITGAEALGYDYIEGKLNAIAALEEGEFRKMVELVRSSRIPVEKCCLLFPKMMVVIGPDADRKAITHYLHGAFSRMRELGSELVVFGSGKSRNIPAGMSYQDAFKDLVDITRLTGEIAQEYGIRIAIEALNRSETNLINSLTEAACLQAVVGLDNVGILADAYHILTENEPMEAIKLVAPVMHAHIATRGSRGYPTCIDEDMIEFFEALVQSGYDQTVSIEGKTEDWAGDSALCLETMKSIVEGAVKNNG